MNKSSNTNDKKEKCRDYTILLNVYISIGRTYDEKP